jgi:hypothetical protein
MGQENMKRTRPVRTRLLAQPLPPDMRKPGPPPSKSAIKAAFREGPAYEPDYASYALKVLISIMAYGSETARIAAAKVLIQPRYSQPKRDEKAADPEIEVIVEYSGEEPPLAEGDYDTSECDPETEDDELFYRRYGRGFMTFGDD